VRHKPTDIRVSLAYQNERGECALLLGNAGRYLETAVIQLGGQLPATSAETTYPRPFAFLEGIG
jgi:hypothetical protein